MKKGRDLKFSSPCLFSNIYYCSLKSAVERYLSPESGRSATIVFPAFSGRAASICAALSAAPEEIPTSIPSLFAKLLPSTNASSFSIAITSSYILVLSVSGTNPAPIP